MSHLYDYDSGIHAFYRDYMAGDIGVDFGAGLSVDVHQLYVDYCHRAGIIPTCLSRMVSVLVKSHPVHLVRRRYELDGQVVSPKGCLIFGPFRCHPGFERSDLGWRIRGFKSVLKGRLAQQTGRPPLQTSHPALDES